jgi:hypothetical protein
MKFNKKINKKKIYQIKKQLLQQQHQMSSGLTPILYEVM